MYVKGIVNLLITILAVGVMVCMAMILSTVEKIAESNVIATLPPDHPVYRRWAVIETEFSSGDNLARVERCHIVSPEGNWYIVPEYHQAMIDEIVEGQELKLPGSVHSWIAPYSHRNDSQRLLRGHVEHKDGKLEGGESYESITRGIYFFGSPI